jgi:hypothetical protein
MAAPVRIAVCRTGVDRPHPAAVAHAVVTFVMPHQRRPGVAAEITVDCLTGALILLAQRRDRLIRGG